MRRKHVAQRVVLPDRLIADPHWLGGVGGVA
jgi:hypothetical protein